MDAPQHLPFPATHWSLVRRAGHADAAARRQALTILLQRYAPALASYLRVNRRLPADDVDDLVQAFIADQVLEKEMLRHAQEGRGRFRSFLLTCLNNFAATRYHARSRHRAAPLENVATPARDEAPDKTVQAAWARALVNAVLQTMREECTRTHREDVWTVFQSRVLADAYTAQPAVPYERLAAQLQLSSPAQAANLLVTAKRMYARLLRAAVAEYESSDTAIDAEIADLRAILADSPGAAEA